MAFMKAREIHQVFRPQKKIVPGKGVHVSTYQGEWVVCLCRDVFNLVGFHGNITLLHRHHRSDKYHFQIESQWCTRQGASGLIGYIEKHDGGQRISYDYNVVSMDDILPHIQGNEIIKYFETTVNDEDFLLCEDLDDVDYINEMLETWLNSFQEKRHLLSSDVYAYIEKGIHGSYVDKDAFAESLDDV